LDGPPTDESHGIHQPWIHLNDIGIFHDAVTRNCRPDGQSFARAIGDSVQFRNELITCLLKDLSKNRIDYLS
jgi:hypothetical protein